MDEDPDVHTLTYAFRIPSSLQDATSLQPLYESLDYLTPLVTIVPDSASGPLPSSTIFFF